jgi:6-phosphogluconolactonase (cycloisomerase 2 family)
MNAIRRCINVLILFGLFASSAVVAVPLYVTMPDNSTLTLDIALTDTVESVKEKIALTENIAVYKQKLKFNGVWLVNENALNSNVNPVAASSTLQLIINSPPVVTIPNQGSVAIVDQHYIASFAIVDDDGDEITWRKKETVDYQFPTWLTFYKLSWGTGVRFTPLVEHIGDHNVCFIADDGQEESENCYVLTVKPKPIKFSVVSFDFFEDIPAALDLSDIELTGSEDGQITLKLHPEAGSLSGFTEGDDIGSGVNISLDSSSLLLIGTYAEIIIYLSQAERLLFNAPLNFSGTIDLEITLFDENDNLFTLYTELIVTPINDPPVTKIGELRERFYCDKQYCKVAGNNVYTRTPGGLYHTKDGRFIYSIDSYDDELMVMQRDPDSGYTFDSITHEIPRSQFFGDQFYALRMRMSFDETKLFVLGEKGLMVLNRDSETGAVTRLYTEKIDSNLDMLITKDGKNVYLLTDTGINTYAYDDVAHTLTLSSTLPLQSGSFSFEMTDDEKFIHVANAIDDTLIVIQRESNGADLTVKHTYVDSINGIVGLKFTPHDYSPGARLPSFVLHTTFDNKSLYVLSNVENSLTLFDRNLDTGNLTYKKRYSSADQGFESVELGSFITSSADSSNIYLLSGSGFPLSIYNRHSISGELSLRDRFSNDRDDNVRNIQDPRFLLVINDDRNYYIADHNIWGFIELSDTKNNFSYTENSLPVTLNTSEQITDIDNTELMSLTFRISNLVNSGDEILGFVGELPASIIADDYDAQAGELRFSGLSSIGNYSQLLSRITYFNASTQPTSEQRIITVVVNDGVDDSETDYIYIDIDEVFDDPVEQSITVTTDNIYIDIDGVFDDPVEQSITVTTTSSGGSLSLLMLLIMAGMALFRKPKILGVLGIMLATNASANNLFTCNITPNMNVRLILLGILVDK